MTVLGNGSYTIGAWQLEDSLIPRILPDCTILPNGVVVTTNGYQVSVTLSNRTVPKLSMEGTCVVALQHGSSTGEHVVFVVTHALWFSASVVLSNTEVSMVTST